MSAASGAGLVAPAGTRGARLRLGAGLALILIWLVASAYSLWYFAVRDRRVFDPQARSDPDELVAALTSGQARARLPTLYAGGDADCGCGPVSLWHLRDLARDYLPRGVRVVLVPGPRVRDPEHLRETLGPGLEVLARDPARIALPAAPAAIVVDAQGRVQYYGPLTDGLLCASGAGGPVERTLDLVLAGEAQPFLNRLGVACVCEWDRPAGR